MNWKQLPTMECPSCSEIEFEHIDTLRGSANQPAVLEYKCNSCGETGYFDETRRLKETTSGEVIPKAKGVGAQGVVADSHKSIFARLGHVQSNNLHKQETT